MTTALIELTSGELSQLERCEATIEKGQRTFIEVGEALATVRDNRLYREEYKTFEAYCDKRWGWSKTQCNRVIASASVVPNLTPKGVIPQSERVARPLTKLPADEQSDAWSEAVETAPKGRVTAKHVERVVAKRIPVKVEAREPGDDPKPKPNGSEVWPLRDRKRAAKLLGQLIRVLDQSPDIWAKAVPHTDALTLLVEGRD